MSSHTPMDREIIFLTLQFLKDEKLGESAHKVEKESGVFFDTRYFGSLLMNGEWEKLEDYLSGFIKVFENAYSARLLFGILRQRYLEALHNNDHAKAVVILTKELKVFSQYGFGADYEYLAYLLKQGNFRARHETTPYGDNTFTRGILLHQMEKLIWGNPVFRGKLQFPNLNDSRLATLMNQSLSWQHLNCQKPKPVPDLKSLFADHHCEEPDDVQDQSISATPGAKATSAVRTDETSSNAADTDGLKKAYVDQKGDGKDLSKPAGNLPKSATWNFTIIAKQSQLRSLMLPDHLLFMTVIRLMYTSSGNSILALTGDGVHKLWKWEQNERNVTGQATASVPPRLYQPRSGILMTNDLSETKLEEAVPCLALTTNGSYVVSTSGGKISIFNIENFKVMSTFMPPPPAATCFVFHPVDNNVIAVAMEDSTIRIYNVKKNQETHTLRGHQRRVTGLAFSSVLDILVSSSADAQLYVWGVPEWKSKNCKFLEFPLGRATTDPLAQTRIQFDKAQTLLLVVHEFQIAIYNKLPRLELLYQWLSGSLTGAITDATYSSDCKSVYATFKDGSAKVFTAFKLTLRCEINPTSYLPSTCPSLSVYPLAIAAHPCKTNQFAIGLSDGGVYVLEPLEEQGTWGICA